MPTPASLHSIHSISRGGARSPREEAATLTSISDFIIAVADLLEAEGRSLRHSVVRLSWGLIFMAGAALLGITAFGFVLWGLYQYLARATDPAAAALLLGVIALALAGILALGTRWLTR